MLYDRVIAEEKLKSGTKYERLAAIVFRLLTGANAVHDLRLRGDGRSTHHQIDVVVGPQRRRVLVECKDYDQLRPVTLSVIRDFYGAVHELRPDEAWVVTTSRFTSPAQIFANENGIRLAELDTTENRVTTVELVVVGYQMTCPRVTFDVVDATSEPLDSSSTTLIWQGVETPVAEWALAPGRQLTDGWHEGWVWAQEEFDPPATLRSPSGLTVTRSARIAVYWQSTTHTRIVGDPMAAVFFRLVGPNAKPRSFSEDELRRYVVDAKGQVVERLST